MDENNTSDNTELNSEEIDTTTSSTGYQFDMDDSATESESTENNSINRILVQQTARPSSVSAPSKQNVDTTPKAETKVEEKKPQNLDNVVIKNFSPSGFYEDKKEEPTSSPSYNSYSSDDNAEFTYGHNVVESSSLVDGGFQPTIELKEKPFVSPQKKMKSQEAVLLMAIIALMVVSILFFGMKALNTKPKKDPVIEKPFKNRPVASDEINIYTSAERVAGFKESEFDQLFYEAYFKGIDGTLKVPRKEYIIYQKVDNAYFEIDINPERWFYTKNIEKVSNTGTMLFVLATDYRFNEINIRTIPDETAENFRNLENAEIYEVNGWTFVYAEDKSILGYYPLTDKTDFCYYFANSYLSDNALYNFFDCLTTNVNFTKLSEEDVPYEYIDVYSELEKKPSAKTNLQINNLITIQTYNENTHLLSWKSEATHNIIRMQINDLPDFTFNIYELDDPLTDSNIGEFGIATVEEVPYRNLVYYIAKDSSGKIIGIYIPNNLKNSGSPKECYIEIDTKVEDYNLDELLTRLFADIVTIK